MKFRKNTVRHKSSRTDPLLIQYFTSDNLFFINLLGIQLLLFLASMHISIWPGKKQKPNQPQALFPKTKTEGKNCKQQGLKHIFRRKQF